jgi:hypothetical protein
MSVAIGMALRTNTLNIDKNGAAPRHFVAAEASWNV